jgi:hypothetical protein
VIDWISVVVNSLWILGCAIILAVLGYADWLANLRKGRLREVLSGAGFQASLHGGTVLVCLGLLFTSRRWWEYVAWGLLAAIFATQCFLVWQARRRQSGFVDGD